MKFSLIFTSRAKQQLEILSPKDRNQYKKAFQTFSNYGPAYRSLRTHRYRYKGGDIWGSSASMAKRFYWEYRETKIILIASIDSH